MKIKGVFDSSLHLIHMVYLTDTKLDFTLLTIFTFIFLVADTQLYKRLCPSIHPSVRPLVRPSVGP